MFRGYDTSALYREDTILRIRRLEAEIAEIQEEIDRSRRQGDDCMLVFQVGIHCNGRLVRVT